MAPTHFLAARDTIAPQHLTKGQVLLVILLCTPFLATITILAIWCHRKRAENKTVAAVLAARVRIARYNAAERTRLEAVRANIDGESIRTLAIFEGIVPENVATGRSGYRAPPPAPLTSRSPAHHSAPFTFQR